MEPERSRITPNQASAPERRPATPSVSPEQPPGAGESTSGSEQEAQPRPAADGSLTLPAVQPSPPPPAPPPAPADEAATAAVSAPDVADDVDVIEKEWVDRAKKIIAETKDDPHTQEEEFEKLQVEYHRKRYGRDIKSRS